MAPHNDTISRRSFLRRTSAGVSGLLIASSLPLPLKGAEKSGSAEGTDRTEAYSDTWLSDSVPTPPQRLSRIVHTLADTGFSGVWGRELKDPDWDFSEVSEAGVDAQILYGRAALSVARNAPLRFFPGELLVGSATLLPSALHKIPCMGETSSTSHTTLGFERALKMG